MSKKERKIQRERKREREIERESERKKEIKWERDDMAVDWNATPAL